MHTPATSGGRSPQLWRCHVLQDVRLLAAALQREQHRSALLDHMRELFEARSQETFCFGDIDAARWLCAGRALLSTCLRGPGKCD